MGLNSFQLVLSVFAVAVISFAVFFLIFQKKIHKRVIRYFKKRDDEF